MNQFTYNKIASRCVIDCYGSTNVLKSFDITIKNDVLNHMYSIVNNGSSNIAYSITLNKRLFNNFIADFRK